jgi:hypothetical protein
MPKVLAATLKTFCAETLVKWLHARSFKIRRVAKFAFAVANRPLDIASARELTSF